ncbi:hypothetical protein Tco_0320742 [Tanacetum coccineum]
MQVVQIILWYLDSGCSKLDLEEWMASVRISSGPEPFMMTPGQLNSGLATSHVPATTYIPPTDKDLEIFIPRCVAAGPTIEDTSITQADLYSSVNPIEGEPSSAQSTSGVRCLAETKHVMSTTGSSQKMDQGSPS